MQFQLQPQVICICLDHFLQEMIVMLLWNLIYKSIDQLQWLEEILFNSRVFVQL